jgi:ABC-type transport system involved in cytochrome bd biosynthesis fused ATPase/permease subunit
VCVCVCVCVGSERGIKIGKGGLGKKGEIHLLQSLSNGISVPLQVGGALPGGILVRGLSGGEKRRLNIACALLASPSILFLDEPTTGLDSFAALNVMEHMSELARVGHTVIASIHQPRSAIWDMFHKVQHKDL